MKKAYIITCIYLFAMMNLARANETRMGTLMAGDYIDDLVNISVFPHHIGIFHNNFYGDIADSSEDYGIIITPDINYGALAFWQTNIPDGRFNLGYGINLYNFDIGVFGSPVKDHTQFGIGIGRAFFTSRIDFSFLVNDAPVNKSYQFNARLSKRKGDFIIVPKYKLNYIQEPYEYSNHIIGLMIQRLILNEGFVFLVAEYDFTRGDLESDYTNFYAGLELPMSRVVVLRLGISEQFTNGFESPVWQVEPGIGLQIREFSIDFHFNKDRIFADDATLVNFIGLNSIGLDLNFGRF